MRRLMLFVVLGLSVIFWGCSKSADNTPTGSTHVHTAGDGHDHTEGTSATQESVHEVDGWCVS
ncbi:MAG: hypothetical protein LBE12_20565, partial [Planctomycetaceae bacterium]|nr:hypothetical protein [Planctomycetaceae bacterium]